MRDPLRVRVTGPLAPFASAFVAELGRRGYARVSVVAQMQLVAHLSRWVADEGVVANVLTAGRVQEFVEARRAAGYRHFLRPSALSPLLECLRGLEVTPTADAEALRLRLIYSSGATAAIWSPSGGWRHRPCASTSASRGGFWARCSSTRASSTWRL